RLSRWLILAALPALLLLGLPVLVLVLRGLAIGSVLEALSSPADLDALWLSAVTTGTTVVLIIVLGLPVSLLLARGKFRGQRVFETIIDLPIVLPPSVAGIALLLVFGRQGVLGKELADVGLTLPFTAAAVVLAQFFVAAPFFIRSARTGILAVEP